MILLRAWFIGLALAGAWYALEWYMAPEPVALFSPMLRIEAVR